MKQATPPRLFHRLLQKMFNNTPMEEIEGDLLDDFQRNTEQYGQTRARIYFIADVLRLVRLVPRSRRSTQQSKTMNNLFMYHLKFGLRSIKRYRVYQSLNMASLTLGFTCFALIYLFIFNQYQKDSNLQQPEKIVRLIGVYDGKTGLGIHSGLPSVLAKDFPEIEMMSRLQNYTAEVYNTEKQEKFQEKVLNTDPDFISIFQIPIIQGDIDLLPSNGVFISESLKQKLFPNQKEVLGEKLFINFNNRESEVLVSGIMEDMPVNSSYAANIVKPLIVNEQYADLNGRMFVSYAAFFKLSPEADKQALSAKLNEKLKDYTESESVLKPEYFFRDLNEIKENPEWSGGFIQSVDGQTILIFKVVGLVVLLLAVANYVNLTTALTLKRSHEVGVKHMMGASNSSLIRQLMIESGIIGSISILLSVLLVSSLLPEIEAYIGLPLAINPAYMLWVPVIGIGSLLLLIILASLYPAFLFSNARFNELLQRKSSNTHKTRWVRSGLMALQFAISTFLIIGSLTFMKQLRFINDSHNLGEISNVLIVKGKPGDRLAVIKQRLQSLPEINQLSFASFVPGPSDNGRMGIGTNDFKESMDVYIIDQSFLDIMDLKVVEGQNFFQDDRNDFNHILFNEAMLEITKEGHPLNKEYKLYGDAPSKVIGIVENFPIGSLKAEVKPTVYMQVEQNDWFARSVNKVAIQLNSKDPLDAIQKVEATWQEIFPDQPFEAEFMNDRIAKLYTNELKMGQLFGIFTGVAVVISCLGIIGLLTYLIQIKMKEIGIRKVLGANFFTLIGLLTKNIWKVLVVASLIIFPLSYYFLEDWLTSFVYRTNISAELFIGTLMIFVIIVGLTVIWQVRNAVRINPTEVLRNE
ncbi:ABC transporter permease [Roseivirga sp.]|uniref:ABC transporter permease n=1 Tax=Roseivirga sp. TaxID=1964215 RepID=UPI003B52E2B5